MSTADKGLLALIRQLLAPVVQRTSGNAQLARDLRLRFSTPLDSLHRFQFEFLGKRPQFFWHAALPLETLFQVYLLRESWSRPQINEDRPEFSPSPERKIVYPKLRHLLNRERGKSHDASENGQPRGWYP